MTESVSKIIPTAIISATLAGLCVIVLSNMQQQNTEELRREVFRKDAVASRALMLNKLDAYGQQELTILNRIEGEVK